MKLLIHVIKPVQYLMKLIMLASKYQTLSTPHTIECPQHHLQATLYYTSHTLPHQYQISSYRLSTHQQQTSHTNKISHPIDFPLHHILSTLPTNTKHTLINTSLPGLRGHHPRSRRLHGPHGLPTSHGYLCSRVFLQFHQVSLFFYFDVCFITDYHTYKNFARMASPLKLVQTILALKPEEQLQVFSLLEESLKKRNLLNA